MLDAQVPLPLLLLACSNNDFALYGYDYIWEIRGGWGSLVENPEAGCRGGEHTIPEDQGHVISSEHASGAERILMSYHTDGSSTVANAGGKRTTYRFQTIQGVRRITAIEGEPSANCPNSNSSFTYDDRGLEVSRTEAYGTPQARTVTTEWHSTLFLPATVTEPDRVTSYSYDAQGRLIGQATTQH